VIAVSVIIPYYGEREALHRCLQSLGRQTLGNDEFEVIVVNNRPERKLSLSRDILLSNVTIADEQQPGSYAARNRGVRLARGRWLAFTDADCIADRRWLEEGLRRVAQQDPLGGHIELTVANPDSLAEQYDVVFGLDQRFYVQERGFAATANLLVSRDVFQKVGPFAASLRSAGDVEWCRRASRMGHAVGYCPEAIVYHPARTRCRQILRQTVRFQGGFYSLERDFQLALARGVARAPVDLLFPRLHIARIVALKKSGHRLWWRLYLLACLLNGFALVERWRLRLGGTPFR
jgi:GT2 family glycosyltransferase